jgi:hypothetical protein
MFACFVMSSSLHAQNIEKADTTLPTAAREAYDGGYCRKNIICRNAGFLKKMGLL